MSASRTSRGYGRGGCKFSERPRNPGCLSKFKGDFVEIETDDKVDTGLTSAE